MSAWRLSRAAWCFEHGFASAPSLGEISPLQRARLSARALARFEAERRAAWDRAAEGFAAWRAQVLAANRAGEVIEAEASASALELLRDERALAAEFEARAARTADLDARLAGHWTRETARVGALVWTHLHRWMRVSRVNRDTVTLAPLAGGRFAPRVAWCDALRGNPHDPEDRPETSETSEMGETGEMGEQT